MSPGLFGYVFHTLVLISMIVVDGNGLDLQGPLFLHEPLHRIEFSNNSGAHADCTAHGSPPPEVEWILADGTAVHQIPELRLLYSNGSLVFPPFPGERYRHDIHSTTYRCRLRNAIGVVLSRDVHIRAVVKQKYDVQVYDEYVVTGNTAVLKCQVPSYVAEFVMVTSWIQDGAVNIYPNTDIGGKYVVLSNGDLHINNAGPNDALKSYTCRTINRLTGETHTSTYPGRIIITDPKGDVQPRVTTEKHASRHVTLGEDFTLTCVAQGYPVPTYRWFRERQDQIVPLAFSDRVALISPSLLKISKIRLEDGGKYMCWVNNSIGEETVQITLTISSALITHIQPQIQTVDVGKEASFQCITSGHPQNRVTWYHNGKPIAGDSRIHVDDTSNRLQIKQLQKEDHGMYQCYVGNEWDQSQAIAELDLGDASPELIYWFSEQTLQPGPMVSLKCVANGNPPPQFTWSLDGFPVPDNARFLVGQYVTIHDDVISHVNITSVKEEDGGEYACTAHNAVGKVQHSARVNVYGLPYIREMPKVTGVAGSNLMIKCPASGFPLELITWERDNQVLPINSRQKVYANGTLIIEQTQRNEDAGTYTCQAQNKQRNSARRDVEIQIIVPPKIIPMTSMSNILREGMRAALTCQIMEGDLPITFRWERNRHPIVTGVNSMSTRRMDEYSASLVIDKVRSEHSGNYTCIASNVAGSERNTVPLTVNVAPKWTIEPTDTNVAAGQDVAIHCQADGYPAPTITWKKAIGEFPGEYKDFFFEPNVYKHPNGSLTFAQITKDSEGHYLCEAKNNIGTGVSKVVFVKVNAPAKFPQKSKYIQVIKGEPAHLQCTALGDIPIEISWKMAGQQIGDAMDQRYTIREQLLDDSMVSELGISHTYRQDTGSFSCFASNAFGHDEMTIQLTVQEVPEHPKNIRVIDQQSRSIQLSWTQPYAGNSPITSYVVQFKSGTDPWPSQPTKVTVSGIQTTAAIVNLHPATSYQMRIISENRLGPSEPSEVIQITTLEETPSGAPVDIRAEAKSSTELVVTWEPPPRDLWNGNLLGYYVWYQETVDTPTTSSSFTGAPQWTLSPQMSNFKTVEVRAHFGGETILRDLNKFTTYSIAVQAYNSRGSGPTSDSVTARTMEDAPSLPPDNVQCSVLSSQSIHVSWEPPPTDGRNGIILGYKVSHHPVEEWYEKDDEETKVITVQRTTVPGLKKFTNYSISVLAFTNSGDGVRSVPVFCHTDEDVPSTPADIKAVSSASGKVIVSWMPPKHSNGVLTGYTFYMSVFENGEEEGTHKRFFTPNVEIHETTRLKEKATYQFWVTASTRIGEGEASKVVTISPSNKVPARITSFGREIITAWKENIELQCHRVGVPTPMISWKQSEKAVEASGRREIKKNGTLLIRDIQHTDEGNYTCLVENNHGRDDITYMIRVRVPPDPPILTVVDSYADSLLLQWTDQRHGGSPILGYVINYKRAHGDWEEIQMDARSNSHILRNLWCGTRYQLYITAFNKIGTGLPCDIVTALTKGSVPAKPKQSQVITMNTTVVTLWLHSWNDGGCPISYFIVEYHPMDSSQWILVSNNVKPTERLLSFPDLKPGVEYQIKVTAYNNAGSTVVLYNFTTLTVQGVLVDVQSPAPHETNRPFYGNFKVITPILLSVVVLAALVAVVFFMHKRKSRNESTCSSSRQLGESPSLAQMQNKQNRDQQYLAVRVNRAGQPTMSADSTYKTDSDYIEDICPYATFQLTKPAYSESSYSGNVYSGPYHSVRGSFVYHDVKPSTSTAEKHKGKDSEYTKLRRKGGKLRDVHSESQESDNLGSTDSEVKKILTLHLPISEYDTLGSDSEEVDHHSAAPRANANETHTTHELTSFRHLMNRDIPKAPNEASSSSSETSLGSMSRKHFSSRKSKSKAASLSKRHVRSSSGYSSHNEETTFSISHESSGYPDRIHPPSRFIDLHLTPRDLRESDCDKAFISSSTTNMGAIRKSPRSRLGKLTRDTFQINV